MPFNSGKSGLARLATSLPPPVSAKFVNALAAHGLTRLPISFRLASVVRTPFSINDEIRAAARVTGLIRELGTNILPWSKIEEGFDVQGHRIRLASKAVGIFKPKELQDGAALSIKQVRPSRSGRHAPYEDRELADGLFAYKLERSGRDNHYLAEASLRHLPLILFRGVADSLYETVFPIYVESIDQTSHVAVVRIDDEPDFSGSIETPYAKLVGLIEEPIARKYTPVMQNSRHHQRAFRRRVLLAYGFRCALSGLPIPQLLEAAHIIRDSAGGEASVRNGIAMSALHHLAYEQNMIGIDPGGIIHVSDAVRATEDGPLLDQGLIQLHGHPLRWPNFEAHRPNRDFLAVRFAEFERTCA